MANLNSGDGKASDFTFENILMESTSLGKSVQLKYITTDVEIFEHMDKPYLTGFLTIVDTNNVIAQSDIRGGESITITIKSTREGAKPFTNKFYISKIVTTQKASSTSETHILHLIEDIAYISNLQNVNRSYRGKVETILSKIADDYLGRELVFGNNSSVQSMKLIVPNMHPIEAMAWIKNAASTIDGYPFYMFSSLFSDNLSFVDLETMLNSTPANKEFPYVYSEGSSRSLDPDVKRRIISSFQIKDTEDLYSIINKGLIGGRYEYIDLLTNRRKSFKYDIKNDLLIPLKNKNILPLLQDEFNYYPYVLEDKEFNQYESRNITNIGGTNAYRTSDDFVDVLSMNEENLLSNYKLNVISDSMDALFKKSPISIDITGADFIAGSNSTVVGLSIKLQFPIVIPEVDESIMKIDTKKSGDYLIFAAKHMFKAEKYDLSLSCLKLSSMRSVE